MDSAAPSAVSGVYDAVLNSVTFRTAHRNGYRSSADLPQQLAGKLRRAAVRVRIYDPLQVGFRLIHVSLQAVYRADPVQRLRNAVRRRIKLGNTKERLDGIVEPVLLIQDVPKEELTRGREAVVRILRQKAFEGAACRIDRTTTELGHRSFIGLFGSSGVRGPSGVHSLQRIRTLERPGTGNPVPVRVDPL